MVVLLVLLTVVALLSVEWLRTRRSPGASRKAVRGFAGLPEAGSVRFLHPGHTWAAFTQDGSAFVGVDDSARRLIGPPDELSLPKPGRRVRQGEPLFGLSHGGRRLVQPAPVSGTVVRVNSAAQSDLLGLLHESPARGWLAVLIPDDRRGELGSLLRGEVAERWQETAWARLASLFGPQLGPVMQDGGEKVDCVSDLLSEGQWQQVVDEMFPTCGPAKGLKDPVKGEVAS